MRNPHVLASLLLLAMPLTAIAQPFPPPSPGAQTPPPDCVDARKSPDYVPGVDARGRAVAPADLPGTPDVQISTEVYVEMRSSNPQWRGVGVNANLAGLATRPPCPPASSQTSPAKR